MFTSQPIGSVETPSAQRASIKSRTDSDLWGGTLPISVTVETVTDAPDYPFDVMVLNATAKNIADAIDCGKIPTVILRANDDGFFTQELLPITKYTLGESGGQPSYEFYLAVESGHYFDNKPFYAEGHDAQPKTEL